MTDVITGSTPTAGAPARRGRRRVGEMKLHIVEKARALFARQGYPTTSIRAVARAAEVDPALVLYYFPSKVALLAECMVPPEAFLHSFESITELPPEQQADEFVRRLLQGWREPDTSSALACIVTAASTEKAAMEQFVELFQRSAPLLALLRRSSPASARSVELRSALIASTLLGLFVSAELWRVDAVAQATDDQIVALVAPAIQHYVSAA